MTDLALASFTEPTTADLKDVLLEFSLNCLLDQPRELNGYAKTYFAMRAKRKTQRAIEQYLQNVSEEAEEEKEIYEDVEPVTIDLPYGLSYHTLGKKRMGVVAEAYDPEKDTDSSSSGGTQDLPLDRQKTLLGVIKECFLFRSLNEAQVEKLLKKMVCKSVHMGEHVIRQYDDGDYFYIIEAGLFDVYIASEKGGLAKKVFTYENTGSFGELALMYNMPRAASIRAATDGILWALDRKNFRRIVVKAAYKKRKHYEDLLSKVKILERLSPYEKMSLADALILKEFKAGDVVFTQGSIADGMYFIEVGRISVSIFDEHLGVEHEVIQLGCGDYFGELSLLRNKPRAGTVTCCEDTTLAFLEIASFERLLGPCINVFNRAAEDYRVAYFRIFGKTPSGHSYVSTGTSTRFSSVA